MHVDDIERGDLLKFSAFLRDQKNQSPRSVYNKFENHSAREAYALLKYCTARSCFWAAARLKNVPRFRLRPVLGFFFCEYNRYCPDFSLRIIGV